jgi:hypothetical protein
MDPKQRNYSHFPPEKEGESEALRIHTLEEEREKALEEEPDDEVRWNKEQEDINNESV